MDVTGEAGLLDPVNSNAAAWADYDNDGWLDLFVACERQPNRLYRNRGDGTFEEVAARAGVAGDKRAVRQGLRLARLRQRRLPRPVRQQPERRRPAVPQRSRRPLHRGHDAMGIDGPHGGFSCWSFDYDNDGWLDIFAICYDRSLADVVRGLLGQPHGPVLATASTATDRARASRT